MTRRHANQTGGPIHGLGLGSRSVRKHPASEREAVDKRAPAKVLLTHLGSICSARLMYDLNGAFNYLHVGWWLRHHGLEPAVRRSSRYELFDFLADKIAEREVLYLEFGVHRGASMRYWSRLLKHPGSRLDGFDSFLGLPHDWSLEGHPRGYFSTGGKAPEIIDPRVRFFSGWFEETLPRYDWPPHDVLVAMFDADLYASTATVLHHVRKRLVPGSYLYFDQFHHRCDELRAFAEFLDEYSIRFQTVGASRDLSNVLFQCVD